MTTRGPLSMPTGIHTAEEIMAHITNVVATPAKSVPPKVGKTKAMTDAALDALSSAVDDGTEYCDHIDPEAIMAALRERGFDVVPIVTREEQARKRRLELLATWWDYRETWSRTYGADENGNPEVNSNGCWETTEHLSDPDASTHVRFDKVRDLIVAEGLPICFANGWQLGNRKIDYGAWTGIDRRVSFR